MRVQAVCIGIHVHAQPERLYATLDSVRRHTRDPAEILLLPDGADAETQAALSALGDLPQLATGHALGAPACFNRLVTFADANLYVLLESGSVVGPGWLTYLKAALDGDFTNGLAGPSTNLSWNEQCVFPHAVGTPAEIARTAKAAAQRFGSTWCTLEPLYSLADFCYAVRREVIEAVGAADEGYGLGPCWEMDYSIRAARAGFRGVWAQAAYVYRSPFTPRRRQEETRHFQASKQRYQDKFCALRLRGEQRAYEPHCRGEECEHFAPADLIQIQLPLPEVAPPVKPQTASMLKRDASPPTVSCSETVPLISCIMPTCDRAEYVLQSIHYFQRQDYPLRELIIIGDGAQDLSEQIPDDPRIRYLHLAARQSIGTKRNRACEMARGSFIAQWDDDDWYAPDRLTAQAAPILSGSADMSGLYETIFFDLPRWEFWRCTPDLHRRLFVEDIHGGTLVYRRHVWERYARYPDRSLAEDAIFLQQAVRRGARLCRLPNNGLFLYLRHAENSWAFTCGRHRDPQGWQRVPEPSLSPSDRAFYAARSPAAPIVSAGSPPPQPTTAQPSVSCIMPTANRRAFVPQAIRYFLRQDYPNCELIVVDDGTDAVVDLIPPDPRIRYVQLEEKHTIGAKRNLACREARGDIIVHWDDDDWIAPWRLRYQVENLLREEGDVCGLDQVIYLDLSLERSWLYVYPKGSRPWVAGNTLCYTHALWRRSPFPDINVGEDTRFVWSHGSKRICPLQDFSFYVALIHPGNTAPKCTAGNRWQSYPIDQVRNLMGEDWVFYTLLAQKG